MTQVRHAAARSLKVAPGKYSRAALGGFFFYAEAKSCPKGLHVVDFPHMTTQAEVIKSGNENPLATIRKFSRKVQGAGLVKTLRARRYFARDASKKVKKKRALKMLKRRAEYRQLVKEGKVAEPARRGNYPQSSTPKPSFGEGTPIAR